MSGSVLVGHAIVDILAVVTLAHAFSLVANRFGQPRVVGQILAGVSLGPTVLGDSLSRTLAPEPVCEVLSVLGALGLVLFMFLTGLEFERSRLSGRHLQVVLLAALSVGLPAAAGFPLAFMLQGEAFAAVADPSPTVTGLYLGAALAVTAFPVMAHILLETGDFDTPLGALAVAVGAVATILVFVYLGFASAWTAGEGLGTFAIQVGCLGLFVSVAWLGVRPMLARVLVRGTLHGRLGEELLLVGLLPFALTTHLLGASALLGGFLWGVVLPEVESLRRAVVTRVRDVTMTLLLPVFFASAGLSTDLRLISFEILPSVVLLLLAAVASKFGAVVPAKAMGFSWREAMTLGALLNNRGLLVIVVGLAGLDAGILARATFAMIVVVALATSLMTVPISRMVRSIE